MNFFFFFKSLLLICFSLNGTFARLIGVNVLSRHGLRSPNDGVLELCPKNWRNIQTYRSWGVADGALTGFGMSEMYEAGRWARERYSTELNFLPPVYHRETLEMQASKSDRTIQSADLFGEGLHPVGSGALPLVGEHARFAKIARIPIPVVSQNADVDNLFEIRKAKCAKRLKVDMKHWDATMGRKLMKQKEDLLNILGKICSSTVANITNPTQQADTIKDIVDMWDFDNGNGLPMMPGLTPEILQSARELSTQLLLGRLYATDAQKTYMMGQLAHSFLENFEQASKSSTGKMWAFHGHRELSYAAGFFYGIPLEFSNWNMPVNVTGDNVGQLPSATTIYMELHDGGHLNATNRHVEVFVWAPCSTKIGAQGIKVENSLVLCPARPVKIIGCQHYECAYENFVALANIRFARTGNWRQICGLEKGSLSFERFAVEQSSSNPIESANVPFLAPKSSSSLFVNVVILPSVASTCFAFFVGAIITGGVKKFLAIRTSSQYNSI